MAGIVIIKNNSKSIYNCTWFYKKPLGSSTIMDAPSPVSPADHESMDSGNCQGGTVYIPEQHMTEEEMTGLYPKTMIDHDGVHEVTYNDELTKKITKGISGMDLLEWRNTEAPGHEDMQEVDSNTVSPGFSMRFKGNDGVVDMNNVRLGQSYFEEGDTRLETLRKTLPYHCRGCYENMIPGTELWCGGCNNAVYCSKSHQLKEWTGEHGISHGQYCRNAMEKGMIGKTILNLFIDDTIGSGLFTLVEFKEGEHVLITRAAKESQEEVIARMHVAAQNNAKAREVLAQAESASPEEVAKANKPSDAQKIAPGMFDEKKAVLDKLGTPVHVNEITTFIPLYANQPNYLCYEIALINHSCSPNCALLFDGFRFYVTALKPIAKGDQLTIRYDDPFSTLREDMNIVSYPARLWERYGIKCPPDCKCKQTSFWTSYGAVMKVSTKFVALATRMEERLKEGPISPVQGDRIKNAAQNLHSKAKKIYAYNKEDVPLRFTFRILELHLTVLTKLDGSPLQIEQMTKALNKARKCA